MAKRLAVLLAMTAGLFLTTTGLAAAGPVTIHDAAGILDSGQVTSAGNALSDPVEIYTVNAFSGGSAAFDSETSKDLKGPTDVVIAINTKPHQVAIRTGADSHIRDTSAALQAFKNAFGTGNYTGAAVAALQSLASTANQAGPHSNASGPQAAHYQSRSSGHVGWLGILCPVIVIGLIVAAVVAVFRRRGRRGGSFGGGGFGGGMPGGGVPGGYGQGGYGGGYGPGGYGPGYNQGGGMSPGMAGGLGAAGGGLLGYELGKMEGRDEERDRGGYDQGGYDQGGYQGGGDQYGGGGGDAYFGGDSGDGGGGGFDGGGGGFDGGGDGSF